MSIQSRIDRERFGPSLFEVTLGAALSLLLGAVLAAGYMIFTPVKTGRDVPKDGEIARGEVHYVEGSKSTARSSQWMRKRQLLIEGQPAEIVIVEDELNAWVADGAKPAAGAEAAASPGFLAPTAINFRIRDGVMQLGVPARLNAFGYTHPVIFQMRGGFEQRNGRFVFAPSESYLGCLSLHRLPAVSEWLAGRIADTQSVTAEVAEAWGRVSDVKLEGTSLTLTLR